MKRRFVVLLTSPLILSTGCLTLQVKHAPPSGVQSVPGLPFYVKKAACLHTAIWFEPVYTLTLEFVTPPADPKAKSTSVQVGSTSLSLSQFKGGPAQKLFQTLNSSPEDMAAVIDKWKAVAAQDGTPYIATTFPEENNRVLISNLSEPQTYVDYSDPYYLNVRRPLAGTAKIDNKIASDGTLTEVSVEIEDKTIEAIGTAVKDIASAVGTGAVGFDASGSTQHAKLTIATGGFKHSYSTYDGATLPCPITKAEATGQYLRTDIAASDKKPDTKTDAKGSKITVSGEIVLPETKPTPGKGNGDASPKTTNTAIPDAPKAKKAAKKTPK